MYLSVIVPLYNEEEIAEKTFATLEQELAEIEHELIFVNDGSTDRTREILENLLPKTPRNKLINFSRNFGHQAAFSAGLKQARGKAVVIIDGDLQDPPALIHDMLKKSMRSGKSEKGKHSSKRLRRTLSTRFSMRSRTSTSRWTQATFA